MKYIRTYENIDFDDFDWIEDENKFDFILDEADKHKLCIIKLDKTNYESFWEFCKNNNIVCYPSSYWWDYNGVLVYIRKSKTGYNLTFSKSVPREGDYWHPDIKIHNMINENIDFDDWDYMKLNGKKIKSGTTIYHIKFPISKYGTCTWWIPEETLSHTSINEMVDFDEDDFEWMDEEPNFNYGYWGNNENWYDSIYVITDGDKIFKNYHLTNGSLPNISKLDKSQLKELKDNNYSIAVYMGNKQKDNWIYMRYKDLVKKYPEFNIDNL